MRERVAAESGLKQVEWWIRSAGGTGRRTRITTPTRNGRGSLAVVGTGIQLGLQLTVEARDEIERADEVLHVVADPLAANWLASLNRSARSLTTLLPGRGAPAD